MTSRPFWSIFSLTVQAVNALPSVFDRMIRFERSAQRDHALVHFSLTVPGEIACFTRRGRSAQRDPALTRLGPIGQWWPQLHRC